MGHLTNLFIIVSLFYVCHGAIFMFMNFDYAFLTPDENGYFTLNGANGAINVEYLKKGEFEELADVNAIKFNSPRVLMAESKSKLYNEVMAAAKKLKTDSKILIQFVGISDTLRDTPDEIPKDIAAFLKKTTKAPLKPEDTKLKGIGDYRTLTVKVNGKELKHLSKNANFDALIEKLQAQNTQFEADLKKFEESTASLFGNLFDEK